METASFQRIVPRFADEALNTIVFAGVATVITLILGLVVAYAMRLAPGRLSLWSYRLSTVGYAAPERSSPSAS